MRTRKPDMTDEEADQVIKAKIKEAGFDTFETFIYNTASLLKDSEMNRALDAKLKFKGRGSRTKETLSDLSLSFLPSAGSALESIGAAILDFVDEKTQGK